MILHHKNGRSETISESGVSKLQHLAEHLALARNCRRVENPSTGKMKDTDQHRPEYHIICMYIYIYICIYMYTDVDMHICT